MADDAQEYQVMVLNRPIKVACLYSGMDLDAAIKLLDETFQDMERLLGLKYERALSDLDTSTWMLTGALNLAHRVLCLERKAALQARDLEEPLSKLLESIPDDVIPNGPNTSANWPPLVE
ncbi:MAG: hypothetical protein LBC63_05720 [Holophagales bacterium]|jgi:hypothetical protein|nr:hypothetical protein [Holophagales bacterium]